jgi:hypothetical protein
MKRQQFFLNILKSLQTTLAADVHLTGQFLTDELKVNTEKSLRYRAGTRSPTDSKREGQHLKPR